MSQIGGFIDCAVKTAYYVYMSQIGGFNMKVSYENSIEFKVREVIQKSTSSVILREDLLMLGSYRQISRVLKKLIASKELAKISQGIYAKAYESEYLDYPLLENGLEEVTQTALNRLNIEWDSSAAVKAYNKGETQQVPVNSTIRLRTRCRRKFSYAGHRLRFEGNVNAT